MKRYARIDRLAREGVRYTNYYATSPVCAPSKFALLTGMYEAGTGPGQNMRANGVPPHGVTGIAAYLRNAGYWTSESGNVDHSCDIAGLP